MVSESASPSDAGDNITGDVLPSSVLCMTGAGIGAGMGVADGAHSSSGESCTVAALTTDTADALGTSTGFRSAISLA